MCRARKLTETARRYFRFFKFLDCFSRGLSFFYGDEILEGLKWSFMGLYLGLESLTIVSFCAEDSGNGTDEDTSWMPSVYGLHHGLKPVCLTLISAGGSRCSARLL